MPENLFADIIIELNKLEVAISLKWSLHIPLKPLVVFREA